MDQAVAKILSIVALETLEKMAFVFGTTVEDQAAAEKKGEPVTVQVRFRGPFCGALELTISEAVLPELAANMLGIDENGPIGRDHQQDALCEIANVVCGRLLPLIGGRKAEFFIDQPAILSSQSTGGSPSRRIEALVIALGSVPIATVKTDGTLTRMFSIDSAPLSGISICSGSRSRNS